MSRMYYLTRVLLNNGYEKCGGSGGAEYFYKIAEDRHVLGVVVCDSNQTDVISDAGIHRMRSCYKRSLHNMNDSDILVIVFGDKKSTAFTEDNIMIVDEFCRRIEKVRVDQKFSPVVALARKSVAYSVLEPSAGKGDIVKYLLEKAKSCSNVTLDIDCIEKDPNLRHILKGNDMRVVHDDFLTYDTMKAYDMIIMNPPFSEGCLHLQKAIRMQERSGGAIVCLLNAETLKNQCSNDRIALMKMIEQHNGSIEFIQDGFLDAERKTAVEVALVKVQIPKPEARSSIIDTLKREKKVQEPAAPECAYLVGSDFIKAIVDQYKMEVEAGCRLIREYEGMKPFILSEFKRNDDGSFQSTECILSLNLCTQRNYYDGNASINEYIRLVRKKYWKTLDRKSVV